jgi:hypothetical protein
VIRAIVVVGWLGLALLVVAAAFGYAVRDEESAQRHLVAGMFAAAALLFVDLCLVVYLQGTRRLVRRTVAELGLGGTWARDQRALARRGTAVGLLAALALVGTFAIGFPTFSGAIAAWKHHALAAAAALLQVIALLVGARVLRRGEDQLAALGREVEAVRYTAPAAAAGSGPHPAQET